MNLPDSPQALTIKIWIIIGIILTSFTFGEIALAEESNGIMKTKFDVYFSEDDFTTQGPNHNILVLNEGNSTQINVYVKNNDDVPHKIRWSSPTDSNSNTFSTFKFEPDETLVFPNKTNSTKLFLTVANQTDTHGTFVTFLGQSELFGMKGLGFYLVVGGDGMQWTDYSLRSGLPGAAFPRLETSISEEDATKIIANGMSLPKYLPQGYKLRGATDWGDSQQIVYSKFPVSNMTESIQFWKDDGLMVFYGIDGPNVNNTQSLPFRIAQDEGQEVRINGLLGSAADQTVRTVMYSNSTYKEPSSLNFFDDGEKISVSIKANLPLDELLQVASSITKIDSNGNNQVQNKLIEIEDRGGFDNEKFSMSPLKQFHSGITLNEVQCSENLVLIQKYDGSPACVKPKTKDKLIARGWTNNQLAFDHLDIQSIEGRFVNLNPQGMCASITLERMSQEEAFKIQSQGKKIKFFEINENDLREMPVLDELIRATHLIEFPAKDNVQTELGMKELVNYEFYIMNKSIAKYGDTQTDYFMKLDTDLDDRLADPKKQGFSNEFDSPQIVYNGKVYVLGHTVFWTSDEHVPHPLSVHLKDELNKDKRFVTLSDEDLESIPKIKEMIDEIGTKFESVYASKGLPENPDWNNYREWLELKKESFDAKTVYVPGFVYKNEYYSLGFPIC